MSKALAIMFATALLGLVCNPVWSAGTLKVTAPSSGSLMKGKTYTIKWRKGNAGAYVKIQLLKSGKAYKTIKVKTKNDGKHRWKVPASLKTSSKYKIRITTLTNTSESDVSNKTFTISKTPMIELASKTLKKKSKKKKSKKKTKGKTTYRGVTAKQWKTIAKYGDPLNCQGRVRRFEKIKKGTYLSEKDCVGRPFCIQDALKKSSVVILRGGTYNIPDTINIYGKTLMGMSGENIKINAKGVKTAVELDKGTLANINIQYAEDVGVKFGSNALAYRVVVGNTGVNMKRVNTEGHGFDLNQNFDMYNVTGNCLVSTEAYNGYNHDGKISTTGLNGDNADGYSMKHGANNVTFIDAHAHHNTDDGFDFWWAGTKSPNPTIRIFYSSANYNGKHRTRKNGDGNGYKFGSSVLGNKRYLEYDQGERFIYGSVACKNKARGFDRNGTTMRIKAIACSASGNRVNNYEDVSCKSAKDPYALKCSMF